MMFSDSEPSGRVFSTQIYTKVSKKKSKISWKLLLLQMVTAASTADNLFNVPFHFAFPFSFLASISRQEVSAGGGMEIMVNL